MLPNLPPAAWWLGIGMILIVIEIGSLTFAFLFFGISALLVAFATWQLGLDHRALEIALFAFFGLASMLLLRRRLRTAYSRSSGATSDIGRLLTITSELAAGQTGHVVYQGVTWQVRNDAATDLHAGDQALIVAIDSIQLVVKPVTPASTPVASDRSF